MTLKHAPRAATPGTLAHLAFASLALLAAIGCSGKGTEGTCVDGATCGGDPTGNWTVVGSCQYAADQIIQPLGPGENVKNPQPPVLTASPVAATTSGEWCSRLFYAFNPTDPAVSTSHIREVDLPHGAPALTSGGSVSFNADFTYSVRLNFVGGNATHFAPLCLQVGGATPSCPDLAANLQTFYVTKAGVDANNAPVPPAFDTISCSDSAQGGCDCQYNYSVVLTDAGNWANLGKVLTQSSTASSYQYNGQPVAASQTPSKALAASFCVNGGSLTMSGYNGTSISDAPGLRVLSLVKQ